MTDSRASHAIRVRRPMRSARNPSLLTQDEVPHPARSKMHRRHFAPGIASEPHGFALIVEAVGEAGAQPAVYAGAGGDYQRIAEQPGLIRGGDFITGVATDKC